MAAAKKQTEAPATAPEHAVEPESKRAKKTAESVNQARARRNAERARKGRPARKK